MVAGYGMIVQPTLHHSPQPLALLGDGERTHLHQFFLDRSQLGPKPFLARQTFHDEAAASVLLAADMREAQEVERLWLASFAQPAVLVGEPSELDHSINRVFSGCKLKPNCSIRDFSPRQELLGIVLVLEPDDYTVAAGVTSSPLIHPQVQDIMKIRVGEQWRYYPSYTIDNFQFERKIKLIRRPGYRK
jgi:hypothetical protein